MTAYTKILIFMLLVSFNLKFIGSYVVIDDLITFKLFNGKTKNEKVEIGQSGKCEKRKKLRILIHGWLDLGAKNLTHSYFYPGVTEGYVSLGSNVVAVDWTAYNKLEYISTALIIVPQVGNVVAKFVEKFAKLCDIPLDDVHLIGHSLGAHVIGFAGKAIQNQLKKKIGRLTGLDPAGPVYITLDDTKRLSKEDGTHVDTIISDAIFQGMYHSCGHVNFYLNGGVSKYLLFAHYFAPMVFEQTILKSMYVGNIMCDNDQKRQCAKGTKNYVGEKVDFNKPGDFYVAVNYETVLKIFFKNT